MASRYEINEEARVPSGLHNGQLIAPGKDLTLKVWDHITSSYLTLYRENGTAIGTETTTDAFGRVEGPDGNGVWVDKLDHDLEWYSGASLLYRQKVRRGEDRLLTVESGRFIAPAATGVLATDSAAVLATIQAAAAAKGVAEIRDRGARYVCAVDVASLSHVKIRGDATLHCPMAGDDALKLTDCPDAEVEGLWVQGESGSRNGIRLERCHRAKVRVRCQGSGAEGVYAEECIHIDVDAYVGIDVQSPYPTSVANATGGVKLTWDGVNADSGCNQFTLSGFYVIGKDRGWAVEIIRAEGGYIESIIPELSKGGIKLDTCENVILDGYYGEANPSDIEYATGTVQTTNADATVIGTGTAWNTNDGEGNKNAMVGKFFIIGTTYGRVLSITNDTSIELEANWNNSASGQAYTLISCDLYMKGCDRCVVNGGRGGGAVILEDSSQNLLNLLTERIFLDANSNRNYGRVVTNRVSATGSRKVDNGTGNRITQLNWQSGALVAGQPALLDVNGQNFIAPQRFSVADNWADQAPGVTAAVKIFEKLATDYIYGQEQSDPAAPPSNIGVFYFRDNGAGKTQLVARFPTGAIQVIATEP